MTRRPVGTVDVAGIRVTVSLRIGFDDIEYVGRLWFSAESSARAEVSDRAALSGRSVEEVVALAERLTPDELQRRYQRAILEKRRYRALRTATEELLATIRYLNQVATTLRAGLTDLDGAAEEIATTEARLHEMVDRLRLVAGVEGDETPSS